MRTLKILGTVFIIGWGVNALMSSDISTAQASEPKPEKSVSEKIADFPQTLPVRTVKRIEKNVQHWFSHSEHDDMRGTDQEYTSNTSLNHMRFNFPYDHGTSLSINYRSYPFMMKGEHKPSHVKTKEVFLVATDGQLDCGYNGCMVRVRFDNGKVQHFSASRAAGGNNQAIFIDNPQRFVNEVAKHKTAIVEVDFWQYGAQQFTFALKDEKNVTYSS